MLFDESKTVETRRDEAGRERARGVVKGGTVEQRTTREEDDARRGRRAKRTTRCAAILSIVTVHIKRWSSDASSERTDAVSFSFLLHEGVTQSGDEKLLVGERRVGDAVIVVYAPDGLAEKVTHAEHGELGEISLGSVRDGVGDDNFGERFVRQPVDGGR